jgi:threonine dehydrogenase-like Zn-dependent dehydrogenase
MRAPHQAGSFPWPVKYGYASVGRVTEGDANLVGKSVFCLFPHQDAYVVDSNRVLLLPQGLPEARAVIAANLETALNALWDAPVLIGDRVSVVGAGVVGCLVAFLAASQAGAEVELIDTNSERRDVAEALGATFAEPGSASRERDLVFHTSGSEAGLKTALGLPRSEGGVIELSWYGDTPVTLPLGCDFHARRLKLSSSQVGTVSPNARSRYNHRERLALALALCKDERLDVLFEPELSFNELPRLLPTLLSATSRALCQRIAYPAPMGDSSSAHRVD